MAEQTARREESGSRGATQDTLHNGAAQALSRQMERESRRYPMKFTQ